MAEMSGLKISSWITAEAILTSRNSESGMQVPSLGRLHVPLRKDGERDRLSSERPKQHLQSIHSFRRSG